MNDVDLDEILRRHPRGYYAECEDVGRLVDEVLRMRAEIAAHRCPESIYPLARLMAQDFYGGGR